MRTSLLQTTGTIASDPVCSLTSFTSHGPAVASPPRSCTPRRRPSTEPAPRLLRPTPEAECHWRYNWPSEAEGMWWGSLWGWHTRGVWDARSPSIPAAPSQLGSVRALVVTPDRGSGCSLSWTGNSICHLASGCCSSSWAGWLNNGCLWSCKYSYYLLGWSYDLMVIK